jgi:hypothetical protein
MMSLVVRVMNECVSSLLLSLSYRYCHDHHLFRKPHRINSLIELTYAYRIRVSIS